MSGDLFQFDSADLLWASGFFVLGVVAGIRLAVWWLTKAKPASEQIDADVQTLRDLPSPTSLPGMFDDEPELPFTGASGCPMGFSGDPNDCTCADEAPAGLESPSPTDARPAGYLSDRLAGGPW